MLDTFRDADTYVSPWLLCIHMKCCNGESEYVQKSKHGLIENATIINPLKMVLMHLNVFVPHNVEKNKNFRTFRHVPRNKHGRVSLPHFA